jgi:hypothetical protein
MTLIIYAATAASKEDFVAFWERQYFYPLERLYLDNIGPPLTAERAHQLFMWKNGYRLTAGKRRAVEEHFISRAGELNSLSPDTDAEEFLKRFAAGDAIWRIFWLHCWQPDRFPIYDQHVHRAMVFIEEQRLEEIPRAGPAKVQHYLGRYLRFRERFRGLNQRSVDKALWSYGKFVKVTRFPLPPG